MIEICQHCFKVERCTEVGRLFLCEKHRDLKQYQQKESKPSKIRRVSVKRSKQESLYSVNRKKYLEKHEVCECCNSTPSTEIHHKKGRVEDLIHDSRYFMAVCRGCHEYIELNPEWAKKNMFSLDRL